MLGHGAARLDDVLNLLPARLTAFAIAIAASRPLYGQRPSATRALATWLTDARETESPNAGHPMAAMAGALGVSLAKRDAYVLGAGFREPGPTDIARAVQLARTAATLVAAGLLGALMATRGR
jgi:adenosylcobinamide-phosphate synthase